MNKNTILITLLFSASIQINCNDNDHPAGQACSSLQRLTIAYRDLKTFDSKQQKLVKALEQSNQEAIDTFKDEKPDFFNFKFRDDSSGWSSPLFIALCEAARNDFTENHGTFKGLYLLQKKGCITKEALLERFPKAFGELPTGSTVLSCIRAMGATRLSENLARMVFKHDTNSEKLTIYLDRGSMHLRYLFAATYLPPSTEEIVVFSEFPEANL